MKFLKGAGVLLALAYLQGAFAQSDDTTWICRSDTSEAMYVHMFTSDTFPDNRGSFNMVDTGDALDGKYINFDYQFGNPHPGYAGFKIFWDNGIASFWVTDCDSMVFYHKGPLPGHKVKMVWAQGSAGCGTPINYEYFGEFTSSATWKREAFGFPPGFVKTGLFELRMLIYNDSIGADTSSISAKGNLKIDNIFFFKGPPRALVIQTQPQSQTVAVNGTVTLTVVADGSAPSYQWLKDGNPITGAISSIYTIASAQTSDAGSYTVVITNSLGAVTSNAATLTVNSSGSGSSSKKSGCGSGFALAFIPPLFYKVIANRKRKKSA